MQVYEVGGAVRDALLGLPASDRDWVVVGATPQQMLDAGYQPVGRDFPVFLHPRTRRGVRAGAHRAQVGAAATTASSSTPRPTSRWSRTWRAAT